MLVLAPLLAVSRIAVNYLFGVYRLVWRYVGLLEALRMAQSIAVVTTVLLFCRLVLSPYVPRLTFPLSIIVMEGMFTFFAMAGARFLPRILRERARPDAG